MKMLAVRNFSTSHLYFFQQISPGATKSVYINLRFHCHYSPYLVLVFVFNPLLPEGPRFNEKNRLELDRVKSISHSWAVKG